MALSDSLDSRINARATGTRTPADEAAWTALYGKALGTVRALSWRPRWGETFQGDPADSLAPMQPCIRDLAEDAVHEAMVGAFLGEQGRAQALPPIALTSAPSSETARRLVGMGKATLMFWHRAPSRYFAQGTHGQVKVGTMTERGIRLRALALTRSQVESGALILEEALAIVATLPGHTRDTLRRMRAIARAEEAQAIEPDLAPDFVGPRRAPLLDRLRPAGCERDPLDHHAPSERRWRRRVSDARTATRAAVADRETFRRKLGQR